MSELLEHLAPVISPFCESPALMYEDLAITGAAAARLVLKCQMIMQVQCNCMLGSVPLQNPLQLAQLFRLREI